jgi:hypothetical protein
MGNSVFIGCTKLSSVKFEGAIYLRDYYPAFPGDLHTKYLAGGIGTYTTKNPGYDAVWTKQ